MGTKITPAINDFYIEDIGSGVSVSSFLANKIAAQSQLYRERMLQVFEFGVAGSYYTPSLPQYGVGTKEVLEFNYEILNVWVISEISGTSGTTEVDIERAALGSSTWGTIFNQTPQFTSASANDALTDYLAKSANATGVTRPTLNTTTLNAGDRLRFVLKNAMQGGGSITVKLHLRLR